MVGLVAVCHSRALARAAVALAAEMVPAGTVPIEIAAGLDETTFGTDAVAITAAVTAADRDGDGVVVLMDLGSAVLSAELALELLDDQTRERVLLCPAPLVEGLVAAAVTAAGGADRDEVAAEALASLSGKQSQLTPLPTPTAPTEPAPPAAPAAPAAPAGPAPATAPIAPAASIGPTASTGLTAPASPLAPAAPGGPGVPAAPSGPTGPAAVVTVNNSHGLHARPAARLVAEARALDATVEIRNRTTGSPWVGASSLSRVATLGVLQGHQLEIRASGPQAGTAVDRIVELAARAFDEPPAPSPASTTPPPATPASQKLPSGADTVPADAAAAFAPRTAGGGRVDAPVETVRLLGQPASAGVAVGPAHQLRAVAPDIPDTPSQGAAVEWRRIEDGLEAVRGQTRRLRDGTARESGDGAAAIFDAHLMLLDDAELLDDVRGRIEDGEAAPRAWAGATETVAAAFEGLSDPYLRSRVTDVRAVADQVLRALLGVAATETPDAGVVTAADLTRAETAGLDTAGVARLATASDLTPAEPAGLDAGGVAGVVIAADLTPAEAAGLDPGGVAGVLLAYGSASSHAAILARGRGIPAVVAVGPGVLGIPDGTAVALDGGTGEVVVAPSEAVVAAFRGRAEVLVERRRRAAGRAGEPAVTRDGVPVAVGANVGSVADARAAAANGADLAGLVRTEFLFLDRAAAPDPDEQEAVYREIAAAFGGRRITLRTLDVGGDKPLPYLPGPDERNPFLGVRGIRHSLAHPVLLADQLRAIVRVARDVPVSVMFPMVATVAEVVTARRLLDEVTGGKAPAGLRVGIMVEVPATALKAAAFASHVDFVSIGTNDLIQYALAAERGNAAVAGLADGLDPGVLRLVDAACRGMGERVAVCGELAADETAIPLLLGLGVRQLSVAPAAVPTVKEAVRETTLGPAAAAALTLADADAVRALLTRGATDSIEDPLDAASPQPGQGA